MQIRPPAKVTADFADRTDATCPPRSVFIRVIRGRMFSRSELLEHSLTLFRSSRYTWPRCDWLIAVADRRSRRTRDAPEPRFGANLDGRSFPLPGDRGRYAKECLLMDRPKTIFKYEPFALRPIQNLKASSVHFGSPLSFNDPYDCALTASIAGTSREHLEQLRSECLTSSAYPEAVRRTIPSLSLEEFEAQIRRGAQVVLDQARDNFLRKNGVTCFSETNDNLLMWSHYGGRYKGYCLEFHTEFKPFDKLQRVRYVTEMPQFQLSDFIRNENHRQLMDMFCTKSSDWSYEKEWRALHAEAGTLFTYEREALKSIYFGPDIEPQDRDLLCIIMYCQYPEAELWIGKRSSTLFRVEFEKAQEYLPYAEARRRGLA